jgi:hypothetical protein
LEKHLHIVCHDVPYPANYGGVVDLFYKIRALCCQEIKIHLHCFEYGRGVQPELEKYCVEVNYYHRQKGHKGISARLPYIVCSRINEELYQNLLKDNYPILIEGIHCSFLLFDNRFNERNIILRLHNVEYKYYRQLFISTTSPFKKFYYLYESSLLKQYEKSVAKAAPIWCVSENDRLAYIEEFNASNIRHLPVFLPYQNINIPSGTGCFCMYHGNLAVEENEKAALFLIRKVFDNLSIPFVVAGKNPSRALRKAAEKNHYTCLIADPSENELQDLIRKAQINILPSYINTGIKLKLLNALFNGRHCIVNESTVAGTGLEPLCHIAGNADSFKNFVTQLFTKPVSPDKTCCRKELLTSMFNNGRNAQTIIQSIW